MRRAFWTLLVIILVSTIGFTQGREDDHDDKGPIQVGYAIVTPVSATTSGLVVFETFGLKKGEDNLQAGILPSEMSTSGLMFVSTNGRLSRNLGVAIANPGTADASVTMTLRREDGMVVGSPKTITIGAGRQTAQFVTQLFADRSDVPRDLIGTLGITSNTPVALVGLRFRGENFSTLPITNLSPPAPVPQRGAGVGGPGAVILAHFAAGGGWATEIVAANSSDTTLMVRVDLFKQDGTPLSIRLNNQSASTFNLTIPPRGVTTLAPRDKDGDSRF